MGLCLGLVLELVLELWLDLGLVGMELSLGLRIEMWRDSRPWEGSQKSHIGWKELRIKPLSGSQTSPETEVIIVKDKKPPKRFLYFTMSHFTLVPENSIKAP